jgi:DNA repair protein RadC
MEDIKLLPPMERPREKLQLNGPSSLSDAEILAILIGSGNKNVPLSAICERLLEGARLKDIAAMDMETLCRYKGIGPAKATMLLATGEFSRRLLPGARSLTDEQAIYHYLRPAFEKAQQLQYVLLLISAGRELLAFAEAGSVLPDIAWVTGLAAEAGAKRVLLARNGWPAFSNAEGRYLKELEAAAAVLGMVSGGLMAVGPERFKMM